ncbi:MAG TPA: hypothetical protein VMB51_06045 [Solirubrobacteraceae bacterium]|nr:hypothetical protein [Solirubrobacteraceae bacterium]
MQGPAAPDRDDSRQLEAGWVGRAHGLDGSFYVTRPRPHLLTLGATVTIGGRTAKIARRAGADRRPIVRLEDVTDRADAEALHGQALTVHVRDAPVLAEDEYWAHQLEGCTVLDGSREIGTVVRVIELPSCEALEVRVPSAGAVSDARALALGEAPDAHAMPVGAPPDAHAMRVGEAPDAHAVRVGEAPDTHAMPVGEALLIPMVKDAIRSIDLERARIEVNMSFIEG